MKRLRNYENYCSAFLAEHNLTRDDYYAKCHTLAYDTIKWLIYHGVKAEGRWMCAGRSSLVTTELSQSRGAYPTWHFHCVVVAHGKVHDAWFGQATPFGVYRGMMFPQNRTVGWSRQVPRSWDHVNPTTFSRLDGTYEDKVRDIDEVIEELMGGKWRGRRW